MFSETMLTAVGAGMPTELPDFGVHSTGGGSRTDPVVGRMGISQQVSDTAFDRYVSEQRQRQVPSGDDHISSKLTPPS
jgi:hypothetical protein